MTKAEFIKKFSKIEETFEDEFRAEFNSPELIWEALKEQLLIHSVVKSLPKCKNYVDGQCTECELNEHKECNV